MQPLNRADDNLRFRVDILRLSGHSGCSRQGELPRQIRACLLGIRGRPDDSLRSRPAAMGACQRRQKHEPSFLVKIHLGFASMALASRGRVAKTPPVGRGRLLSGMDSGRVS